jgi:hypothetical protein
MVNPLAGPALPKDWDTTSVIRLKRSEQPKKQKVKKKYFGPT